MLGFFGSKRPPRCVNSRGPGRHRCGVPTMPRKPDTPCSACGKLLWSGSTSLPEGERTCRPCRRVRSPVQGPEQTFSCSECGKLWKRPTVRGAHPKRCPTCRGNRHWFSKKFRRAIYERDGWLCQICGDPVDGDLPRTDIWSASLDHIVPQSWGEPDHSPDNLRLAHLWCNAVRGDESYYTEEVLRHVG